jgi:N-acetylglucosaminyldiphosphoundecaprenol N-acetyl-beta-D-mannosaminyltransferase
VPRVSRPEVPAGGVEGLRVDVLGVAVSVVTLDSATDRIAQWVRSGERRYVCVTGVHGVMESQRDPDLRKIHNASGLTTPDGMPMVWAAKRAGAPEVTRVYGPDLMRSVLAVAAENGWSSYFYGGRPEVTERLAGRLSAQIPGLAVAGLRSPPYRPLTDAEDEADVDAINASGADVVWVGLSTPKQERWMAAPREQLAAPVLIGVGAAFDLLAGTLRQAPPWMQRSGLEWSYRLAREPRRLWRRYLRNNPAFVAAIARRPPRLVPWPTDIA